MTKPRMTRPSERDRAHYLERERVRDRKRRQAAQVKKDLARRVLPDTPIDVLTQHGHHGPGLLTMKKLARLILAGQNLTQCARRLKKNYTYLKKVACLPEFKVYMAEMEKDYFSALDQRVKHLLGASIEAMGKMLKHPDWRARDVALEKILRLNGKLERLELSGQVRPAIHAELVSEGQAMTEEMRRKAMEILAWQRQQLQQRVPPKMIAAHTEVSDAGQEPR